MAFGDRAISADNMSVALDQFFQSLGFKLYKSGYENHYPDEFRQVVRTVHNNSTVTLIRYFPDNVITFEKKVPQFFSFIEYKICNAPIVYDHRVKFLKEKSGITTLTKDNIGAIETAALDTYLKLSSIGAMVLIVVYSNFHKQNGNRRPFVIMKADRIKKVFSGEVVIGAGNASRTPFTNVNLDDFLSLDEFIKRNFPIEKALVDKQYSELLKLDINE